MEAKHIQRNENKNRRIRQNKRQQQHTIHKRLAFLNDRFKPLPHQIGPGAQHPDHHHDKANANHRISTHARHQSSVPAGRNNNIASDPVFHTIPMINLRRNFRVNRIPNEPTFVVLSS